MRTLPFVAILMAALLAGCRQVPVTSPPGPVLPNAARTLSTDPVPSKVVLKPKSAVSPAEQKLTYDQVIARDRPSDGQPMVLQITKEEARILQGLTIDIIAIGGHKFEVSYRGDDIVGLTNIERKVIPVLSPNHQLVALRYMDNEILEIYDITSGRSIEIPRMAETQPRLAKSKYQWGIDPVWSRDSEYLHFVGHPGGDSLLFRVRRDGSNLIQPCPGTQTARLLGRGANVEVIGMGGEHGNVCIISKYGWVQDVGERTAEIGATSPSDGLLLTAHQWEPFIEVHNLTLPTTEATIIPLPDTYQHAYSPVGWSPSEEHLATVLTSSKGDVAVAIVDWRQERVTMAQPPIGFSQSWLPVMWLNEEAFIIWFQEERPSKPDQRCVPFLVRMPLSPDLSLAEFDLTSVEKVALEFAQAVVTADMKRARRVALAATDIKARSAKFSSRPQTLTQPYIEQGSPRTVETGILLDIWVQCGVDARSNWFRFRMDLVQDIFDQWWVRNMIPYDFGDDNPSQYTGMYPIGKASTL